MENTINAALKGAIKAAGLDLDGKDMKNAIGTLTSFYEEGATGKPLVRAIQGELDCEEDAAREIAEVIDELHEQEADDDDENTEDDDNDDDEENNE